MPFTWGAQERPARLTVLIGPCPPSADWWVHHHQDATAADVVAALLANPEARREVLELMPEHQESVKWQTEYRLRWEAMIEKAPDIDHLEEAAELLREELLAERGTVAKLVELAEATGKCVLANVREDYRYAPELRGNAGYLLAAASQWRLRQSSDQALSAPTAESGKDSKPPGGSLRKDEQCNAYPEVSPVPFPGRESGGAEAPLQPGGAETCDKCGHFICVCGRETPSGLPVAGGNPGGGGEARHSLNEYTVCVRCKRFDPADPCPGEPAPVASAPERVTHSEIRSIGQQLAKSSYPIWGPRIELYATQQEQSDSARLEEVARLRQATRDKDRDLTAYEARLDTVSLERDRLRAELAGAKAGAELATEESRVYLATKLRLDHELESLKRWQANVRKMIRNGSGGFEALDKANDVQANEPEFVPYPPPPEATTSPDPRLAEALANPPGPRHAKLIEAPEATAVWTQPEIDAAKAEGAELFDRLGSDEAKAREALGGAEARFRVGQRVSFWMGNASVERDTVAGDDRTWVKLDKSGALVCPESKLLELLPPEPVDEHTPVKPVGEGVTDNDVALFLDGAEQDWLAERQSDALWGVVCALRALVAKLEREGEANG